MKKFFFRLLFILAMCCGGLLLSSCGGGDARKETAPAGGQDTFPLTVTNYDGSGNAVETVYQKPPARILAIWQNSVETLLSLGAEDQIAAAAGVNDPRHLTEENQKKYAKLPLTSARALSQETAVTLHPDFILGWRFDFTGKANSVGTWDFWRERGVPVYMTNMDGADYLEKHTVEDELAYIMDVGRITGRAEKAREICGNIEKSLSAASRYAAERRQEQKVLFISSMGRQLHIYTPRTLPGDIAARLGGTVLGKAAENVGQDEIMSDEELLMENPDVIFLQSAPELDEERLSAVYKNPKLAGLSCVENRRVYPIPFYTIRDPAVRVQDAIHIIAKGLYPGWEATQ